MNSNHPDTKPKSTLRRQEASRANGSRSHGPTTPEGKLRSSQNSLRHGMLAQTIVLATESTTRFEALLQSLIDEHEPQTESELKLVELMTIAAWKQMRFLALEKAELDHEIALQPRGSGPVPLRAAQAFRKLADTSRALDLNHRYQAACDRQANRALRQLQELQRLHQQQMKKDEPAPIASYVGVAPISATFDPDPEPVLIDGPPENGESILQNEPNPTSGQEPRHHDISSSESSTVRSNDGLGGMDWRSPIPAMRFE